MATQRVRLPHGERDYVGAAASVGGAIGLILWRLEAEDRFVNGRDELRVGGGLSLDF